MTRTNQKLRSETPRKAGWDQAGEGLREGCENALSEPQFEPNAVPACLRKSQQMARDLCGFEAACFIPFDGPTRFAGRKRMRPPCPNGRLAFRLNPLPQPFAQLQRQTELHRCQILSKCGRKSARSSGDRAPDF